MKHHVSKPTHLDTEIYTNLYTIKNFYFRFERIRFGKKRYSTNIDRIYFLSLLSVIRNESLQK